MRLLKGSQLKNITGMQPKIPPGIPHLKNLTMIPLVISLEILSHVPPENRSAIYPSILPGIASGIQNKFLHKYLQRFILGTFTVILLKSFFIVSSRNSSRDSTSMLLEIP